MFAKGREPISFRARPGRDPRTNGVAELGLAVALVGIEIPSPRLAVTPLRVQVTLLTIEIALLAVEVALVGPLISLPGQAITQTVGEVAVSRIMIAPIGIVIASLAQRSRTVLVVTGDDDLRKFTHVGRPLLAVIPVNAPKVDLTSRFTPAVGQPGTGRANYTLL